MGWFLVKLPNRLYGRFSEVVDNFTHINLTEDKIRELCKLENLTAYQTDKKVLQADKESKLYETGFGDVGYRWEYALDMILTVHGFKEFMRVFNVVNNCKNDGVSYVNLGTAQAMKISGNKITLFFNRSINSEDYIQVKPERVVIGFKQPEYVTAEDYENAEKAMKDE